MHATVIAIDENAEWEDEESTDLYFDALEEMGAICEHKDNVYYRDFDTVDPHLEIPCRILLMADFSLNREKSKQLWQKGGFYLAEQVFEGKTFDKLLKNIEHYVEERAHA